MLAGIKDILVITTPRDNEGFKTLLGEGCALILGDNIFYGHIYLIGKKCNSKISISRSI